MKKYMLPLFLLVASLAFANQVELGSFDSGTLSGTNAGLTLTGATLTDIEVATSSLFGNLGTITLMTGALTSGSLQAGGTFAGGGAFTIAGNGAQGIFNGALFVGTFTDLTWKLLSVAGTNSYALMGTFTGKWFTGQSVDGAFYVLTENVGKGFFKESADVAGMNVVVSGNQLMVTPVPEPGTLSLTGIGLLLSAAGFVRKRFFGVQ